MINYPNWLGKAIGTMRGIARAYDLPNDVRKEMEDFLKEWDEVNRVESERLYGKKVA